MNSLRDVHSFHQKLHEKTMWIIVNSFINYNQFSLGEKEIGHTIGYARVVLYNTASCYRTKTLTFVLKQSPPWRQTHPGISKHSAV